MTKFDVEAIVADIEAISEKFVYNLNTLSTQTAYVDCLQRTYPDYSFEVTTDGNNINIKGYPKMVTIQLSIPVNWAVKDD